MASNSTFDSDRYKQMFRSFDKDGDGVISISEMYAMLKQMNCNITDKQVIDFFVFMDGTMGDRQITCEEFCSGLEALFSFLEKAKQLFAELDANGDGFLDRSELRVLLVKSGRTFTEKEVDTILMDADRNGDNKISYEEFIRACT